MRSGAEFVRSNNDAVILKHLADQAAEAMVTASAALVPISDHPNSITERIPNVECERAFC